MSGDTTIPDKLVHMHIAMCFFYRIVPRFHIKKPSRKQITSEFCLQRIYPTFRLECQKLLIPVYRP